DDQLIHTIIVAYDTTPHIHLSLHDALPISVSNISLSLAKVWRLPPICLFFSKTSTWYPSPLRIAPHSKPPRPLPTITISYFSIRSEEHTSELQSRENLVCRLLLAKKKNDNE